MGDIHLKISLTHFNGSERFCGNGSKSIRWNNASSMGRNDPCAPAIRSNCMAVKYTHRACGASKPGAVKNPRVSFSIMCSASLSNKSILVESPVAINRKGSPHRKLLLTCK